MKGLNNDEKYKSDWLRQPVESVPLKFNWTYFGRPSVEPGQIVGHRLLSTPFIKCPNGATATRIMGDHTGTRTNPVCARDYVTHLAMRCTKCAAYSHSCQCSSFRRRQSESNTSSRRSLYIFGSSPFADDLCTWHNVFACGLEHTMDKYIQLNIHMYI